MFPLLSHENQLASCVESRLVQTMLFKHIKYLRYNTFAHYLTFFYFGGCLVHYIPHAKQGM
jgi:hypothetical protein